MFEYALMKTKIFYISLFASTIVLFICFFTSCRQDQSPCPPPTTTYSNLSTEYKQNVPYTGQDTIRFIDTANNTLTFIGQGITSGYLCYRDPGSNPDCGGSSETYCYQYFQYNYNEVNNKALLSISNYSRLGNNSGGSYHLDLLSVSFNNKLFYFDDGMICIIDKRTHFYFDKRTFNNKVYNDVYCQYGGTALSTDSIFYNRQFGIISIVTDSTRWSLP